MSSPAGVSVFGCPWVTGSFDAWAGVPPELIGRMPVPPSKAIAVTATEAPAVASRPYRGRTLVCRCLLIAACSA